MGKRESAEERKSSFLTSLPGILTASAALIAACAGLIALFVSNAGGKPAPPGNGKPGGSGGTTISAVVFTGDSQTPTVIITGRGFGPPPAGQPNGSTFCGNYTNNGDNFGPAKLWFEDAGKFAAGATGSCIGIVLQHWSAEQVTYQFGNAYYTFDHWYISTGDRYTLWVNGVPYSGTVSFS